MQSHEIPSLYKDALTHYWIKFLSLVVMHFYLPVYVLNHISRYVEFSAPKLHTSVLVAILYTFVTQTILTH